MAIYLVTGAAGFIGAKVSEFLLAAGHTVVGVDNLSDTYDVRLKQWRLDQINDDANFIFHHLDICDRMALTDLFTHLATCHAQPTAIINLAARAGVRQSVENPWIYAETNTTGTLNLLEVCRHFKIPKFVLASTSSLYGKDNPLPYREEANTDRPLSPYAASKKAAESLCHTYHYLYSVDVTVLRYFTVYGPAGRPDMSLFRFVQWIHEGKPVIVYGDGQQSRDFTYVDDIARGTIAGLKPVGYEVVNLGSDSPIPLLDAIELVERLLGKQACIEFQPAHIADVQATWAHIAKAERLLGWKPLVELEAGVQNLVTWYQENCHWASHIYTG